MLFKLKIVSPILALQIPSPTFTWQMKYCVVSHLEKYLKNTDCFVLAILNVSY